MNVFGPIVRLLVATLCAAFFVSPALAACSSPIAAGAWKGAMRNTLSVVRNDHPPLRITGSSIAVATMDLNIACDGSVSGTFAGVKAHAEFITAMGDAGKPENIDDDTVCDIDGGYTLLSGHAVVGKNGKPALHLKVQTHLGGDKCNGGMLEDVVKGILEQTDVSTTGVYELELESTAVSPGGISGNLSWLNVQGSGAIASMKKSGGVTQESYCWGLSANGSAPPGCGSIASNNPPPPPKEKLPPIINDMRPTLVSDFLAQVPAVQNSYIAKVDWQGATPKAIVFELDDAAGVLVDSRTAADAGGSATAAFEIGDKAPGLYHVKVTATNGDGLKAQKDVPLTIVPTPKWATAIGIHPTGIQQDCTADQPAFACETYAGETEIDWPVQSGNLPHVDIPAFVPFIGGKWGLQPVKFHLPVSITSRGDGFATDNVTGQGFIALGDKNITIDVQKSAGSRTRTNTSDQGVDFAGGHAVGTDVQPSAAVLEMPKIEPITKSIDLLTLIPGAQLVYQIPVLGKIVQVLVPKIVEAQIDLGLSGDTEFGIGEDGKIGLSAGHVTTDLTGTVSFGPNVQVARAQIVGQMNGKLTMTLAPSIGVADCELTYRFFLLVGAGGFQATVPENPALKKITGCTADATALHFGGPPILGVSMLSISRLEMDLGALVASTASADASSSRLHPHLVARVGWRPETAVATVVQGQVPPARRELLLLRDASALVAAPAMASDSSGRVAMAWVAEDPRLPRPQAWQVRLRIFNGRQWSQPIAIGDGTQENQTPTVVFDASGRIVVAWAQNRPPSRGYDQMLSEHSYDGSEIAVALVDPASGSVQRKLLTHDALSDGEPALVAARDGTVWLAWRAVTAGGNIQFKLARWNGSAWSAIEAVDTISDLRAWRFAASDANTALLVATTGDGPTSRVTLRVRSNNAWSAAADLASGLPADAGIAATFGIDGKPVVAWSNGTTILGAEMGAKPRPWLQTTRQPIAIAASGSGLSLVIGGPSGLQVALRLPTRPWSAPASLVRSFASQTTVGVTRTSAGNWLIARAQTPSNSLSRVSAAGGLIPQNSDIILNGPVVKP